jgi:hypothetical protein
MDDVINFFISGGKLVATYMDVLNAADEQHAIAIAQKVEEDMIRSEANAIKEVLNYEIAQLAAAPDGATKAQLDTILARVQGIRNV